MPAASMTAFALVAFLTSVSAQHPTAMRDSLKGIGEITLVIELKADALAKERLRREDRESLLILPRVERKLRMGGMTVNPHIFQDMRPTGLAVKLDVQCSDVAPVCAVGINVRLSRFAQLAASGANVLGVTWHADDTALVPLDKMAGAFAGLDGILDRLVSDYQAVNPKVR